MSSRLLLFALCALGGCAALPAPTLPTCDGSARRPANPHGSILSSAPAATTAGPGVGTPSSGGSA